MASERSKNNRIARYVKGKFSSLLHTSRAPTPLSIGMDSNSDNHIATTVAGASNSALQMVGVNYAPARTPGTEANSASPPISVPISASVPAVPRQLSSASIPGPETSSTHMSLLQGAHNVYLHYPTITMANNVQNLFSADGNKRTSSQTPDHDILCEKLVPRAQFAEYDAASPAPRNACTMNTRKVILNTLRVWAGDNTTTKVYWLNGMAGTGKTTIAYSFSEMLKGRKSLGGSFFSSHLRVDTSDVYCIIPTISLQLAKHLPSLSQLILDVVKADSSPDCSSWSIHKQFINFMFRPLTTAYMDGKGAVPVIVLDALDECSDQSLVAELLSVILKHSKSLPVKFFITSRPEIVVKETFDDSLGHSSFILHEVEKEIVKADIELYIKACLLGSPIKHNWHNWPPQAELERLVDMSGTLFIYAATVCKYITQKGRSSMPQRLSYVVNFRLETTSGLTHPLDCLYEGVLEAAYAFTDSRERSNIDMVLQAVVYAYEPLSMTVISTLMQMPIGHIVAALSSLHSLIYMSSEDPDKPISIFHASFYDFISNQNLSSKHYLDPCASHKHLAFQCLALIEKEWSQKERIPYLAERECEGISKSLSYACNSWAFHFTHVDNNNGSAELKQFFQRHLLRWMDCLSILGRLETAMHSLHKLENWANTQKSLEIIVIDAEHFLKENFDFIKSNSLEGCPSALAWLPEESVIWKTYGSQVNCPWKLSLGRRKAWGFSEAVLRHSNIVYSAAFSPDGMHIVSASHDHTVCIWNTATGECEAELKGHLSSVFSAVFSPDGMHIVSASNDHTARIWNTVTGECEAELKGHSAGVLSAIFSPDGMHIVSVSYDDTARIWNTATGVCEAELEGHSEWVQSAIFSPDGMHIVSASQDHTARLWSTATGECEAELEGHSDWVCSAVFSPNGMLIVSASWDDTARIWDTTTGECKAKLEGHTSGVRSAVFSPDGAHIVSASDDTTARIWNAATGHCEAELKGHTSRVFSAVFSPDSMHILSASQDHTARIWNTATGQCEAELRGHSEWVQSAVFSPNGLHIVSASGDETARIWNMARGEHRAEMEGHDGAVHSVAFSSNGVNIVSASDDSTACIWNTVTGECKAELKVYPSSSVISAVFSPNGVHVVTVSRDFTPQIWNTVTRECEAELKGHSDYVLSAVFSPDGMHVVSASQDHTARIWNTATGECEAELKGHSEWVFSAVFSPDSTHIVSASGDATAHIWNTATGECEVELKGHSDWVGSAVFSSDSKHIVSTSGDHTVWIWNAGTGECEGVLKGHATDSTLSENIQLPVVLSLPDGVFIHNDSHGHIQLSSQLSFIEICEDHIFHTKNLQKIWFPPLFHKPQCISHYLSKICLGYRSGEVLVLEFVD